MINVSIFAKKF